MSLSPAKAVILENLLLNGNPVKPAQIAKETGNQLNSTMMHLIWLVRAGYAVAPEKGQYTIADKGKQVLGIPETTKDIAASILTKSQKEKAFHFYSDVGKPLNLYADGIRDFLEKLPRVTVQSLEFHLSRGDFENWFEGIGDIETSKKLALLKKKLVGEQLRERLQEIVASRCAALSKLL